MKVFNIYGRGGHIGHPVRTFGKIKGSADPWRLQDVDVASVCHNGS